MKYISLTVSEKQKINSSSLFVQKLELIALSNRLSEKNAFYNWYHYYNKKGVKGFCQIKEYLTDSGIEFHKYIRIW